MLLCIMVFLQHSKSDLFECEQLEFTHVIVFANNFITVGKHGFKVKNATTRTVVDINDDGTAGLQFLAGKNVFFPVRYIGARTWCILQRNLFKP